MAVRVAPGLDDYTHHLALRDAHDVFGIKVERREDGTFSLGERPETASTIVIAGVDSVGDPTLAQIKQRDWINGRGQLNFFDDRTRYLDGYMALTMVSGRVSSAPQWRFSEGDTNAINKMMGASLNNLGHSVKWATLQSKRWSHQFTTGETGSGDTWNLEQIQMWLRKIGVPGDLSYAIHSQTSSAPGTLLQSGTIEADDFERNVSQMVDAAITAITLSEGVTYWLVVWDAGAPTKQSHWEIGSGTTDGDQAKSSSDNGSTWDNESLQPYFRVSEASVDRFCEIFEFRNCLYKVTIPADPSVASQLYLNGYRGILTAATATTFTDSNASFTADELKNREAYVEITEGLGAGQVRKITANTGTQGTVATWTTTPDTTSLYRVYAVDMWVDISPTSGDQFDEPITDLRIFDDEVWFARGTKTANQPIFRMRWNDGAGPPTVHQFDDDGTNKADRLHGYTKTVTKYKVIRAQNSNVTVSRSNKPAWNSATTFSSDFDVADDSALINALTDYDGKLVIIKEDDIYDLVGDEAVAWEAGIDFTKSLKNGLANVKKDFFLWITWGEYSLLRLQRNDSITQAAKAGPDLGNGLPVDRAGNISALGTHPAGLMVAVDAGDDGYSSILVRTDPIGYHEIFRAPVKGWRIRNFFWQDNPMTNPRLWVDMGFVSGFQEWPQRGFNTLKDSTVVFQHETHLIFSENDLRNLASLNSLIA